MWFRVRHHSHVNSQVNKFQKVSNSRDKAGGGVVLDCRYVLILEGSKKQHVEMVISEFLLQHDGPETLDVNNAMEIKEMCGALQWVKQLEVYIIQLLDKPLGLLVVSHGLDKAVEAEDVQGRVEEVLFYMNCCLNCLKESFKSNLPPQCKTVCKDCFREKELCDRHSDVYTHWIGDQCSCKQCRDKGLC